jgi:hypothetical protein
MTDQIKLPAHKCGLYLTHNQHRDYYDKLVDFIADGNLAGDFASPEDMQRAIDTDECWVLQWYPNTPVGFCRVAAPTLAEVLALAEKGIS